MDNLESQTYVAFEKDPVKYSQYEKAVVKALEQLPADKTTVLMVNTPANPDCIQMVACFLFAGVGRLTAWGSYCLPKGMDIWRVLGYRVPLEIVCLER